MISVNITLNWYRYWHWYCAVVLISISTSFPSTPSTPSIPSDPECIGGEGMTRERKQEQRLIAWEMRDVFFLYLLVDGWVGVVGRGWPRYSEELIDCGIFRI